MSDYRNRVPYSPYPVPSDPKELPRYIKAELERIAISIERSGSLSWGGYYQNGRCYPAGTVVYDEGWTMVSVRDTCERPAPIATGPQQWTLPDSPTWQSQQVNASTVFSGHRYTFPDYYFVTSARIWLPDSSSNTFYSLVLIDDPDGASPVRQILFEWFNASTVGWNVLGTFKRIVLPNTPYELILLTQNRVGQNTFAANYDYMTPGNTTVPQSGQITHDNQSLDLLRVNKVDADSNDITTDLQTIKPGDLIVGAGVTWTVNTVSYTDPVFTFGVSPSFQGTDSLGPFNFTDFADQPVPYVRIVDQWLNVPEIDGMYLASTGGAGALQMDDNAYGTDIRYQNAVFSEDWEVVGAP